MSEQKHTPLPWVTNTNVANGRPEILGPKGECIALAPYWSYEVQDEQGANFDLLTRAANTHYQLVAALEAVKRDIVPEFLEDHPGSYRALHLLNDALQAAKEQP